LLLDDGKKVLSFLRDKRRKLDKLIRILETMDDFGNLAEQGASSLHNPSELDSASGKKASGRVIKFMPQNQKRTDWDQAKP